MKSRKFRALVALMLVTAAILPLASASGASAKDSTAVHASKRACVPATYSGSGVRKLGTVKMRKRATLRWRSTGKFFQLSARRGFLLVNAHRKSGHLKLGKGVYRGLTVATGGSWKITIRCS